MKTLSIVCNLIDVINQCCKSLTGKHVLQFSAVHHLQSAFEEASSYSRYHPSKGYSWDFTNGKAWAAKEPVREEPSSLFQRQRVDMLLAELTRRFPLQVPKPIHQTTEACTQHLCAFLFSFTYNPIHNIKLTYLIVYLNITKYYSC